MTNGMLFTQSILREIGFASEIFVEHVAPELAEKLKPYRSWNPTPSDVLLLHHSMGHDLDDWIDKLPSKKILVYHNITPPEFFAPDSPFRHYSAKGLEQLHRFRASIHSAIADSELNADDLRAAGYRNVEVIPLLVDVQALWNKPWNHELVRRESEVFTVLFVGRIAPNKCQHELVTVATWLRRVLRRPFQVVCVGSYDETDPYFQRILAEVAAAGLSDRFHFTGKVSEADLYGWYRAAAAFLCLSEHEGFGVPLIEAMTFDLPVIACRTSNIESTLGGAGLLVTEKNLGAIAGLLCVLADDRALRRVVVSGQRARLKEFNAYDLARRLSGYLTRHGVEVPCSADVAAPQNPLPLQYRIEGPFETSYSLAIINRELALALERACPGTIGLFATEGPGDYLPDIAAIESMPAVDTLWRRGASGSRADVVVRNLYPPRVADMDGLINLLYFGWEESSLPTQHVARFNEELDGVCALSEFVQKTLIDNGVALPILPVHCGADHIRSTDAVPFAVPIDDAFVFLHVSSCFPRKGVDVLLGAYFDRFTAQDSVVLVIKTFPNPHNTVREQITSLVGMSRSAAPRIVLLEEDLSPGQMRHLYERCDAFVAPSRGEGFGLPLAEAMWLGKPVITTAYGGQADFCTQDTAWLVDFSFAYAATHMRLFDSVWAEPDRVHLGKLMRELVESPAELIRDRANRARQLVQREYTWERTAAKVAEIVRHIRARKPLAHRRLRFGWFSSWNSKCGIAMYSQHLVERLLQADFDVRVFASVTETALSADGENVFRTWTDRSGPIDDLLDGLDRYEPDAVVVQFNFGFISVHNLARLVHFCKQRQITIVVVFHSTKPVNSDSLTTSLQPIASDLARADRLLVHGIDDLNRLKSYGLVRNAALFPHGVPDWSRVTDPHGHRGNSVVRLATKWRVATYGFMLPHKGLERLVDAIALLRQRGVDVGLIMVSAIYPVPASRDLRDALQRRIARHGLEQAVEIHSDFLPDEDSSRLLEQADLLVFPYTETAESSSAAVRFGLSTRLPVACTPLPIFEDVGEIVHSLGGTLSQDIARGIELLLQDAVLLRSNAERQQEWLEAHRWPNVARRLAAIVRTLHTEEYSVVAAEQPALECSS